MENGRHTCTDRSPCANDVLISPGISLEQFVPFGSLSRSHRQRDSFLRNIDKVNFALNGIELGGLVSTRSSGGKHLPFTCAGDC